MNYNINQLGGGNASFPNNPLKSLWKILVIVSIIAVLFIVMKGLISILYWGAPILLILALLVNHQIVLKYAQDLVDKFKVNVVSGIIGLVILLFGYPFVFAWLLIKGLLFNKIKKTGMFNENANKNFGANLQDFFSLENNINMFSQKKSFQNAPPNRKNKDDDWAEYEEIK